MDGWPARARAWAMLESICRKKRGSSCDSAGIAFLVDLRRPVSQQAVVPSRSPAAEVTRLIALLFLGLGGRVLWDLWHAIREDNGARGAYSRLYRRSRLRRFLRFLLRVFFHHLFDVRHFDAHFLRGF